MKTRPEYTENILRDDISWLEIQVRQLGTASGASGAGERTLADCYQKLLRQRQHQLAYRDSHDGICPGCWQDYFC